MRAATKIAMIAVPLMALLGGGAACAGRMEPIYNVVDHAVPAAAQNLPLAEIERNIMVAGALRHWRFERINPGELRGTFSNSKHEAVIDVTFSPQTYSIHIDHTQNLLQEGDEVHRTYNRWVRNLERDIDDQLTRASLESR